MALQDMFSQASSFQDNPKGMLEFFHGMQNFLPSLGDSFQNYRMWEGGSANPESGGDGGFNESAVWSQLAPNLDKQGYSFGFNPTEGGGSMMNVMQNGNNVGQFRALEDANWIDKYGPMIPWLAAAGVGGLANGFGGAVAGGEGAMSSAIPEAAGANVSELTLGSTPLSTPAPGMGSGLSESLMASGMPQSTAVPGTGLAAQYGAGAGAGLGASELGGLGGSSEKAALYGNTGYTGSAEGLGAMSGVETGLFDGLLGLTGSPEAANMGTNMLGPVFDNPVMDQLRKLRGMLGQKAVGNLTYGDLGRGALTALNYRQNSKALKDQKRGLQGMFGQDSAYAKNMQQQLERRDAAAGRRSQYGNRAVELQGLLANNTARLAPTMDNITQQQNNMRNAMYRTGGQFLNKGLGNNFLEGLFGG